MSDDNERYIGYRPDINYTEEYNTERGNYYRETEEQNKQPQQEKPPIELNDVEDDIKKIDVLLRNYLPSKLRDNVYEIYKPLKDTYYKYIHNQTISGRVDEERYIDNSTNAEYGIYLNRKAISIKKGSEYLLKAYCVPTSDPGNVVTKWESDNTDICTVDNDGIVTGLNIGSATITVTSSYNKTDTCIVSVLDTGSKPNEPSKPDDNDNGDNNKPKPEPPIGDPDKPTNGDEDGIIHVQEVALDRTNIIVKVGHTKQLNATIYPKNATNKTLVWSSSRESYATVDQEGIVTGISIGSCIVTVSSVDGNKSDTCNVLVINDNSNTNPDDNPDHGGGGGSNPPDNPPPGGTDPDKPGGDNKYPPDIPPWTPTIPTKPSIKPDPITPDIEEPEDPDDTPIADDPNVIIIKPKPKPTPSIVEEEFKKNLYDLLKYFMDKLKTSLNKYYRALFTAINKKDLNDFFFIYNDIDISNKDIVSTYRHLLDTAIKTQNISNLKLDFYNSNFNFNQTLYHIKNFMVMYELRKKYESIPYSKNTDKSVSYSNNILRACKHEYSLKYDKAYENLFKYMDSSLTVTDLVITDLIQNVFTKGILTEKGGRNK